MRKGWRGESYRHYLAAKGVSTRRYNASQSNDKSTFEFGLLASGVAGKENATPPPQAPPPQPQQPIIAQPSLSQIERARAQAEEDAKRALRPGYYAAEQGITGNISEAVRLLKEHDEAEKMFKKAKSPADKEMYKQQMLSAGTKAGLMSVVQARAFQLAASGQPIDPEVKKLLPWGVQHRINISERAAQAKLSREFESPFKTAFRKEVPKLAEDVLGAPERGLEIAGAGIISGQESMGGKPYPGLVGQENALESSPFVKTNAVVGWEEQAAPSILKPLSNVEGTRLDGTWDFLGTEQGGVNPILAERRKTFANRVTDQVNSLYENKDKLVDVEFKDFEEGKKNFEKGDREALLNNIIGLHAEEDKLADRQSLIDQTRRLVVSQQNHINAFGSTTGANALFGDSKGGDMLAEQTKKINEVRSAVAERHAEIATRRKMLEHDFSRLMTEVQPSVEMPKQRPTQLSAPKKSLFDAKDNPIVDQLRAGPYGKS